MKRTSGNFLPSDLKYAFNQPEMNVEMTALGIYYFLVILLKSLQLCVKSLFLVPTKLAIAPLGPPDVDKLPMAMVFLAQKGCCFSTLYNGWPILSLICNNILDAFDNAPLDPADKVFFVMT